MKCQNFSSSTLLILFLAVQRPVAAQLRNGWVPDRNPGPELFVTPYSGPGAITCCSSKTYTGYPPGLEFAAPSSLSHLYLSRSTSTTTSTSASGIRTSSLARSAQNFEGQQPTLSAEQTSLTARRDLIPSKDDTVISLAPTTPVPVVRMGTESASRDVAQSHTRNTSVTTVTVMTQITASGPETSSESKVFFSSSYPDGDSLTNKGVTLAKHVGHLGFDNTVLASSLDSITSRGMLDGIKYQDARNVTEPLNLASKSSSRVPTATIPAVTSSTQSLYSLVSDSAQSPLPHSSTKPQYRGFNIANQSPSRFGQLKDREDWSKAFQRIQDLPGNFNAVRLYSTTDGNTKHLQHALPEARARNLSVHVGVWSGGDAHIERFNQEKAALEAAIAMNGCDAIIAVSVGNEDMYSHHRTDDQQTPLTDIMTLVNQTQEVMDLLDKYSCCDVRLTHTDTFGDWLNTSFSEPLIRQVDFLTVNIFPYWSSEHIDTAPAAFWKQLNMTRDMAARYGKEVWIGETGWPISGSRRGSAVPDVENMRRYWKQVGCELMRTTNAFWYVDWDGDVATDNPSFGIMNAEGKSFIDDLGCG